MFSSMNSGANAYMNVGMETGVNAASPHKLITMLYEGALVAITAAIRHMETGQIEAKGLAISKAILIIDSGLRASLNKDEGGELALNLDALYEYLSRRLVTANLKNDAGILQEVYDLLRGLKDSWESIAPQSASTSQQPAIRALNTNPYEVAPQASPRLVKA